MAEKDSNVPNFLPVPVGSYCNISFLLRISVGSTRTIKSICADAEVLSLKFNITFHLTLNDTDTNFEGIFTRSKFTCFIPTINIRVGTEEAHNCGEGVWYEYHSEPKRILMWQYIYELESQ